MTRTTRDASHGLHVGLAVGVGAGLGLLFALLSGVELRSGLVFGAAIGLFAGLAVDTLGPAAHDRGLRHPLMKS